MNNLYSKVIIFKCKDVRSLQMIFLCYLYSYISYIIIIVNEVGFGHMIFDRCFLPKVVLTIKSVTKYCKCWSYVVFWMMFWCHMQTYTVYFVPKWRLHMYYFLRLITLASFSPIPSLVDSDVRLCCRWATKLLYVCTLRYICVTAIISL